MNSPAGTKPPLHRRYDEQDAMTQIRNRYLNCREKIGPQVSDLQESSEFRGKAQAMYGQGYKDWMILMAVYNMRLNRRLLEMGVDMRDPRAARAAMRRVAKEQFSDAISADEFLGDGFEHALCSFNMTVLVTWGFHPRAQMLKPKVVERFLRERMNHFEHDLPHQPLFGEPPGEWPTIEEPSD